MHTSARKKHCELREREKRNCLSLGAGGVNDVWYHYSYPKANKITSAQKSYIQNYIKEFERTMAGTSFSNPTTGWRRLLDESSAIDYMIICELTKNPDAYRNSTFMYKDRASKGGKLHLGPAWDYNIALGYSNRKSDGFRYTENCADCTVFWFQTLMQDPEFVTKVHYRWNALRQTVLSTARLNRYIDSCATLLRPIQQRSYDRYPLTQMFKYPDDVIYDDYDQATGYLKVWLSERSVWLDKQWNRVAPISVVPRQDVNLFSVRKSARLFDIQGRVLQNAKQLPMSGIILTADESVGRLYRAVAIRCLPD